LNIGTPKQSSLIFIFALVVVASGIDLYTDLSHGATLAHIAKEAVIVVLSAIALAWLLNSMRRQKEEIQWLKKEIEEAKHPHRQADEYVLKTRRQVGEVIAQQFEEWGLTGSEKEVGMLLIKGLSLKEISMVRNTLEKTVRQQASAIYGKADMPGRHAFAAWFIEDLL